MKIKTSELTDTALDWAVAKCVYGDDIPAGFPAFSQDWARGGPIIERERIFLKPSKLSPTTAKRIAWGAHGFYGNTEQKVHRHGPTPLIAAMRVFVASKLGDEVEIPEELK